MKKCIGAATIGLSLMLPLLAVASGQCLIGVENQSNVEYIVKFDSTTQGPIKSIHVGAKDMLNTALPMPGMAKEVVDEDSCRDILSAYHISVVAPNTNKKLICQGVDAQTVMDNPTLTISVNQTETGDGATTTSCNIASNE